MPDVAEFDRMFRAVEMTLVPQVPKDVRMRIQTARNLGVYAGFSYDLSAVSAYWSITCIEMALWNRSQEIDPSGETGGETGAACQRGEAGAACQRVGNFW